MPLIESFDDPVAFNEALQEELATNPAFDFLHDLAHLAHEFDEITETPEGCDQFVAKSCELMSAAILINLACRRVAARESETRAERRIVEIMSGGRR